MKNRFTLFKHGFKRLVSLTGLAGLACLVGCTKLSCDFSYSPTTPRAGESVSFSNHSTGADDYYWNFGDNITATTASPSHTYKKPGTYLVTLSIVRNKVEKRTCSQYINVCDTIPELVADNDTIETFSPVKFYVNLYNPWSKAVSYKWIVPDNAVVLAGKSMEPLKKDSSVLVCYFTQRDVTSLVQVDMQMEGKESIHLSYSVIPTHQEASSVLYYQNGEAKEQFCYKINSKPIYSAATITQDTARLNREQDTLYLYGDSIYTVDKVRKLLSDQSIKGFQVDRLMNKIYAYGQGLLVCNITGTYPQKIENASVSAIKVDGGGNRLYWATANGLFTRPLMGTESSLELYTPDTVNRIANITRISVNSNLH